MPLGNASENPSRDRRRLPRTGEGTAVALVIPLGHVGQTRFFLSGVVVLAAIAVVAVVAAMTSRQGNADLPIVAAIGSGFWIAGWLVQVVSQLTICGVFGLRTPEITINLIGVESGPRRWLATQSLLVSLTSLAAMVIAGVLFWWVEGGFRTPVLTPTQPDFWSPPSIGLSSSDSIWRVGAWLFWVQAVCQMFPLPRTTGRQVLAALTSVCSRRLDLPHQVAVFRRCLVAVSLLTLVVAMMMIAGDGSMTIPRWPLILLLALLLWTSSHSSDLADTMIGFQSPRVDERYEQQSIDDNAVKKVIRENEYRIGIFQRVGEAIRTRQNRRRVKRAMVQERREAMDASRLDEILNRLHENGLDALSQEERAILNRVSQALRDRRGDDVTSVPRDNASQLGRRVP